MQLPSVLLLLTYPVFRRTFGPLMKIIGSRLRLSVRGRRQQAALPVEEQVNATKGTAKTFKKRALLIGVQEVREDDPEPGEGPDRPQTPAGRKGKEKTKTKVDSSRALRGPHRDVETMKSLLIETYHYDPTDITTLIDDDEPGHVQPTRDNILSAIADLVADARENDRFFFHFSGHSTQEDTDDIEEEDGKNEFIVASDGQTIKDDELRLHLVQPLPPKSSLIAVFDSCYSGSLLDLKHFRCNQVYVPWINRGERRTNSLWYLNQRRPAAHLSARSDVTTRTVKQVSKLNNQLVRWTQTSIDQLMMSAEVAEKLDVTRSPVVSKKKTSLSIVTDSLPEPSWLDSPIQRCVSPEMLYCSGDCRNNPHFQQDLECLPDVFSLSAAADGQKAWEDEEGRSMTQALVQILRKDPHPSLHNLLTDVSHDLHTLYLTLHLKARAYRKRVQEVNRERKKNGKKPRKGHSVEMNNFQNPQLSSDRPLDMSRRWYP